MTVIDPNAEWTVDVEQFASKSRNCPFHGWKLTGRPVATIVGGDVKWRLDGGRGEFRGRRPASG